ncbi:MAG: T9SS type B sorting domain-containing protein [Saprospiraceae bacterium]|nr:T9SS type B sorting domain-containing protein [Saprospiraceae bacterium]
MDPRYFFFILFTLPTLLFGQINENGIKGYFSFDICEAVDTTDVIFSDYGGGVSGNIIRQAGAMNCVMDCSIRGNSFSMNGLDEQIVFFSGFQSVFNTSDFSIGFYFRPDPGVTKMNLFTKAEMCADSASFTIDYNPSSNQIEATLAQNSSIRTKVTGKLDPDRCWQHVTFVRDDRNSILYINGEQADLATASTRINAKNSSVLVLGSNLCIDRFRGLIDEIAIYDRAINANDVDDLFFHPEEIINRDTTIFLGGSVQIALSKNCADSYQWSPNAEINDATVAEPLISPTATATYQVDMISSDCTAKDEIMITVLDPDDLDCTEVFFPKAFTPNSDNLNDFFRINNPYTIDELISFEILDRWGSRVFFTDNPFEGWDGNFDGQVVNPGVLLYRVRFVCKGVEQTQVGSLTLIR